MITACKLCVFIVVIATNVSSIDESLRVDSVMLRDDDVTSTISFRVSL